MRESSDAARLACIVRASCKYTSALTGFSWLLASLSRAFAVASLTHPSSICTTPPMLNVMSEHKEHQKVSEAKQIPAGVTV